MDPLVAQLRLTNFETAACRRRIVQTRTMIADFERLAAELNFAVLPKRIAPEFTIRATSPIRRLRKQPACGATT